jgi:hypothetical protein
MEPEQGDVLGPDGEHEARWEALDARQQRSDRELASRRCECLHGNIEGVLLREPRGQEQGQPTRTLRQDGALQHGRRRPEELVDTRGVRRLELCAYRRDEALQDEMVSAVIRVGPVDGKDDRHTRRRLVTGECID